MTMNDRERFGRRPRPEFGGADLTDLQCGLLRAVHGLRREGNHRPTTLELANRAGIRVSQVGPPRHQLCLLGLWPLNPSKEGAA